MWLASKFTSLSDSLFKSLFRFLFRYDIFISYARSDGKEYALKLREQLKQLDFSCFLDYDELPPGNSLNDTLRRALRRSAALVVVGTERAVKSRYVELEVGEFAATGRAIIPIDIEGTLAEMPWPVVKERDIVWIDEVKAALARATPSPAVADSIDKLFKYTRRNSRVRAQVLATIGLFIVVVAASLFMIRQQVNAATLASAEAGRQKTEARNQKAAADAASADAVEQRRAADAAAGRAEVAIAEAKTAANRATAAEKAAGDAAAEAKRQERNALASAERAKAQQAVAEERTRYVLAQQTGVQADIALSRDYDLEGSVLLSVESLKGALTPEGYGAWARAMELLPRPSEMAVGGKVENVTAVAYGPGGRLFAEGGEDGSLTLFQTDGTGEPVKLHLQSGGPVKIIVFGDDRGMVAAASEQEVGVWDLKTSRLVNSTRRIRAESIAFSPDGRYLALAVRHSWATVLDTADWSQVAQLKPDVDYVMSVAFSPDGRWLALGCIPGKIAVWDAASFRKDGEKGGRPAGVVAEEQTHFRTIAFSPTGRYLAATDSSGEISLWDVSFPEEAVESSANSVKLSRSSRTLQFSSPARARRTAGALIKQTPLAFSPDEGYLASSLDDNTARVWELASGREVSWMGFEKPIDAIAFSPDGSTLATGGAGLNFWKTEFRGEAVRLTGDDEPNALAVSPRGEWLVAAGRGGARAFRTSDWSPAADLAQAGNVSTLTFSPDGRWLITAGEDRLTAFETGGWKVVHTMQCPGEVSSIGFSPDGRWLLAVCGLTVRLFQSSSWREVPAMAHRDRVVEVSFSPDGRFVAVRSRGLYPRRDIHAMSGRGETFVWDVSSGLPVACRTDTDDYSAREKEETEPSKLKGTLCSDLKVKSQEHLLSEVQNWRKPLRYGVTSGTSPDGRWLVETAGGIKLSFKEGNTVRQVARLMQSDSVNDWVFTPDGRWLAVAGGRAISLWPLKPGEMIDAACARLRRRDLTADELKNYVAGTKLTPTCSPK